MTPDRVRSVLRAGPAGVLVAIAATLVAPGLATALGWLPALVSLGVFGLAHGAVDHHVPARLGDGRAATLRRFVAGYLVLVAVVAVAFWQAPLVAWWTFLVLSAAHWAQGEGWAWRAAGRPAFGSPARALAWALPRGLLPIAGPLVADPDVARRLASALPGVGSAAVPGPGGQAAILVLLVAATVASFAVTAGDRAGHPAWRAEAGEVLVLTTGVAVVPPLLLVGVYFLCWHSPRHVARLVAGDERQVAVLRSRGWAAAIRAFHREALPCTLVALAGLAAALVAATATGVTAVTAVTLAVIAALTLPHAGVVVWMDARQQVWTGGRSPRTAESREDRRAVAQAPAPA